MPGWTQGGVRLLALWLALLLAAPALAAPIAVLPLTQGDRSEAHTGLGAALAGMLVTDLVAAGAELVERERLDALIAEIQLGKSGFVDAASAAKLGAGVGAHQLVVGGYVVLDGALLLDARVVDVASGRVLAALDVQGPVADFVAVEKQLAEQLIDALGLTLSPGDRRRLLLAAPTEQFDAFAAYAAARQAELEGKIDVARAAYAKAVSIDPDFEAAAAAIAAARAVVGDDRAATQAALTDQRVALAAATLARVPRYTAGEPLSDARWADLALRWALMSELGQDCDAADERWRALASAGWPAAVFDRKAAYAPAKALETAGWTTLRSHEDGPAVGRRRLSERVVDTSTLMGAVIGELRGDPRRATDALVGALRRCGTDFPAVLERLERELVKAGHPYTPAAPDALTVTERVRLVRLWHQARSERAPASLARELDAMLQAWPPTTAGGAELRSRIEGIERDALFAHRSRLRRGHLPAAALIAVANAVLERPSPVRLASHLRCTQVMPASRSAFQGALDTLKRAERESLELPILTDVGLDGAGPMATMLLALGCVEGVLGRFETPEEAIAYVADARVRRAELAEPHCDGVFDALDRSTGPGQRRQAATSDEALNGVALGAVSTYFAAGVGGACVLERFSWPY